MRFEKCACAVVGSVPPQIYSSGPPPTGFSVLHTSGSGEHFQEGQLQLAMAHVFSSLQVFDRWRYDLRQKTFLEQIVQGAVKCLTWPSV